MVSFGRTVAAFAAAGFVAFGELYGVQATLPTISDDLGLAPSAASLALSAGAIGLAVAVLPWAIVARHVRRGLLLRIAVVATVLLGPLAVITTSFEVLLAVRFVQGAVIAGVPALAVTHLGDVLDRRQAIIGAGWYVGGNVFGGLCGRLVAGFAGSLADWRVSLVAVSLLSAAGAVLFLVLLPRVSEQAAPPGTTSRALRSPSMWIICALALLQMGMFIATFNYITFRLIGPPFDLSQALVTAVFLVYILGTFASTRAGVLATRLGSRTVITACLIVQAAGLALTIPDGFGFIVPGMALITAGLFGMHAVASGWVAAHGQGSAVPSAVYTISYYAGAGVLGWALGVAFDDGGWAALVTWSLGITAVSGLLMLAWRLLPVSADPHPAPSDLRPAQTEPTP